VTTSFKTRVERRIGVVEITGPLDDHAIPMLHGAITDVAERAGTPRVLIVEDNITATSENAAKALIYECATLRGKGGNLGLVSSDGAVTRGGRPSAQTFYIAAYSSLEFGLERLGKVEFK
jgi:anti-anti-sigma factor